MSNLPLSQELEWRGLVKDKTFNDLNWLDTPKTFYLGIDPTADSLTVGNLAVFILAKRLLNSGWKTVLLVGGATSMVGDPGGKTDERDLLSREQVETNVAGMEAQVKKLFSNQEFTLVDNYDWFKDIKYLDFLRDVGKNYSMTELMQRDYINDRMGKDGSGISYAEFSYSLVQGYDYLHLYKSLGVVLQIGGSDQWGNMLSGVPLIRKKEGTEVQAMSMPLVINKSTGVKFGKSEAGAVWLDPNKTSVLDFYQFWINVNDDDAVDYLKIYTDLDQSAIAEVSDKQKAEPSARHAQHVLAEELTKLVHGEEETEKAKQATAVLVSGSSEVGVVESLPHRQVETPKNIIDLLVELQLVNSRGDARRLLDAGAIYIDGKSINKENLENEDFTNGKLILRRGKALKDSALIELAS